MCFDEPPRLRSVRPSYPVLPSVSEASLTSFGATKGGVRDGVPASPCLFERSEKSLSCGRERLKGETPHIVRGDNKKKGLGATEKWLGATIKKRARGDNKKRLGATIKKGLGATEKWGLGGQKKVRGNRKGARGDKKTLGGDKEGIRRQTGL
jgi:hypothetical protein